MTISKTWLYTAVVLLSLLLIPKPLTITHAQAQQFQYELVMTIDNGIPVNEVKWSPDGNQIAAVEPNRPFPLIKIWNAQTGELKHTFEPPGLFTDTTDIYLGWHPHENLLASTYEAYDMDFVHIWDIDSGDLTTINGTGRGTDIDWSPDGTILVVAHGNVVDQTASLWTIDGDLIARFEPAPPDLYSVDWSPDGSYVVTADEVVHILEEDLDDIWQVWSTETYEESYRLQIPPMTLRPAPKWNNESTCIWGIQCSYECQLLSWNIESDVVTNYEGPDLDLGYGELSLNPSQPLIAYNAGIYIWNTNGTYLGQIQGETYVLSIDWSPSGDMLASSYGDGTILIWKITYAPDDMTSEPTTCGGAATISD